ncbi:MFS transporter [Marinigracilibium pacificum]|uniref:MFS transporter n=1 Tax=Marinigracilibium pacificum TaxID=2729599 RepID=A0A848J863_9BACT|nr:MFS transporter [Marinigracilibium pacificum]NMM50614.1 hypothetical protein [Marinigracilibium pacificum]
MSKTYSVKWRQIWALIFLDIAILISWIAYHKYQPVVLDIFGFSSITKEFLIIQALILLVTPPAAGIFADKIWLKKKEKLPLIKSGINLVTMVFMTVAFTVFIQPDGWWRFLVPILIVFWLILMNVFHSPAFSTFEMFVPEKKYPQVMALFIVLIQLAQAIEPVIIDVLDIFGGPITFAVGGILVFATGFYLQRQFTNLNTSTKRRLSVKKATTSESKPWLVFGLGLIFGIATNFFFNQLPELIDEFGVMSFIDVSGAVKTGLVIAFSALFCYPISLLVSKIGLNKSMIISIILCILFGGVIFLSTGTTTTIAILLFALAYAGLSVSAIPSAFVNLNPQHKVFGLGLFFAAAEFPSSIFEILSV